MCDCNVCKFYRKFESHLEGLDEEKKEFFMDFYELYVETSVDKDYYECIVKGTWPDSDEVIANARAINSQNNQSKGS